jgi:hypothetical protein
LDPRSTHRTRTHTRNTTPHTRAQQRQDEYEGHADESDDDDDEPRVQVDESRSVLLRDYIAQERRKLVPHFRSLSVAVSHLNYTVKALPPAQRHNDVYHACLCCAAEKKKSKKNLLHDVSFYLKPGQMTILLGAPGCGKSTLIKLLANRLRSGKVTGELTFNGKDPRKGNFHQDIAYVPQDDVHIGTYLPYLMHSTPRIPQERVRVRFVCAVCATNSDCVCCVGKNISPADGEGDAAVQRGLPDAQARVEGRPPGARAHDHAAAGPHAPRQHRGGRRPAARRVRRREEARDHRRRDCQEPHHLSPRRAHHRPRLLGRLRRMSTTRCVCRVLACVAHNTTQRTTQVLRALRSGVDMGTTAMVALLQPSYDVFNLFDNVLILSHGEIAFLGSKKDAFAHFESLGYRCHPNVNPAEFLRTATPTRTPTRTHRTHARIAHSC